MSDETTPVADTPVDVPTPVKADPTGPTSEELDAFRAWQKEHAGPEVKTMVDSGAKPVVPDASAMLDQIRAMQAQLDRINAANGTSPTDPIEAHTTALDQHLTQVENAHPNHDFSEVRDAVNEVVNAAKDGTLVKDGTELLKTVIQDHREGPLGSISHDLAYIWDLAKSLHRIVLKG